MSVTPRILFVHAHPDDETIATGGTIAELVAEGDQVTVLTATRGEGGEVIPPELRSLEGDRAGLAEVRETEIAAAMRALGVTDHRFLGTRRGGAATRPERRFEDSGMAWGSDGHAVPAPTMPAGALCAAPVADVAGYIAAVIDEVRPHAVITYAANGGYGHPDHVRVHDATVAAVEAATWTTGRLLFVEVPSEVARASFDPAQPGFAESGFAPAQAIPTKAPSGPIAVAQDVTRSRPAQRAALSAHRTQVSVDGDFYALSNGVGTKLADHEYYSIGAGTPIPAETVQAGPAAHVLAGLDLEAIEDENALAGRRRRREPKKPGVLAFIHAVLLGLLIGFLGGLQHLNVSVVRLGEQPVILPWGLALALLMAVAGLWHLKTMYRSTGPMLVAAIVIALLSYILGQPQWLPGADTIVTGTLRSVVWLLGPMIVAAVFAFTPVMGREKHRAGRPR
ncbi:MULTISPECIES: PIG-L family deacetylase [unclassified Brevibacterium]|uniref:PIG-L family deacetylase n=1 Tax=unclassified Brevibacterium TaxID=2614124 RepID=UPI0010F8AB92|nr:MULTISPECIES: PIG-L family deacetylase [unclassified Brevibacterium]MCM1012102.1 PIG-L family deacetylase [Brevibacterium sp. XM4083]